LTISQRTEFNDLLIESIDETVRDILGAKVNQAFWYHYQAFLGVTRDEMPYRLETLFTSLKTAFGIGGETLGRAIVRKVYAKTSVPLTYVPDKPLVEYIEELKQILAQGTISPTPLTT
jgi:hypothetical protein